MTDDIGNGPAPAGWYPDSANPMRERLWTGERWIAWIRTARIDRVEDPVAGWYVDAGHEGFERLWSGDMWTEEVRRVGIEDAAPAANAAGEAEPPPAQGAAAPSGIAAPASMAPRRVVGPPPVSAGQMTVTYYDESPPDRLGRLSVWVGIALGFTVLAAIGELILGGAFIAIQNNQLKGRPQTLHYMERVIDSVRTMLWLSPLIDLIAAAVFITWFYRAYRNLIRAGIRDLRFAPAWAIGGWFIPFFNAVRQKQIANDIWKASASAGTIGPERRWEVGLSGVLNWWWGVWIAAWVLIALGEGPLRRASVGRLLTSERLEDERNQVWCHQLGLVVLVVAAILAFLFVREVSKLQDQHLRKPEPDPDGFTATRPWAHAQPVTRVAPDPGLAPPPVAATKVCPDCAEDVKAAARVCRFCGHRFADG
jgi:hypothetical protein